MPFKERLKMIMHCMICLIIVLVANWVYHKDSPTTVFAFIISWLYWKELKEWKKSKELKTSQTKNES
jgi:hypothetical protein